MMVGKFVSKGGRRQAECSSTIVALAVLLNGTGCLRFAYGEVDRQSGYRRDAGMDAGASQNQSDAGPHIDPQLPAAGASAGVGGNGSTGGSTGGSKAGVGGDGSDDTGDASVVDAGLLSDAGSVDAATPEAGSGGAGAAASGGAGGASSGGAGGAGGAAAFAICDQQPGVIFCNGFEEAQPWTPNLWSYENVTHGGTEERTTTRTYGGSAAVNFATNDNSRETAARIAYKRLGAMMSGEIWLRYYYYLPSSVTINPYFSAGVMSEQGAPYQGFSLLIYPSSLQIESALIGSQPVTFTFPRNRWVCVEHHAVVDPSTGYFEIYVDGDFKVKTGKGNTVPGGGWTNAEVGIHYVGEGQGPVSVWVDNVVASTTRYGCD